MNSNVSGNPLDNALLEHGVLTLSSDGGPTLRIHVDDIAAVTFDDGERKTVIITPAGLGSTSTDSTSMPWQRTGWIRSGPSTRSGKRTAYAESVSTEHPAPGWPSQKPMTGWAPPPEAAA